MVVARDFSSLNCPHWLLGPPSFLFNGHWVPFLGLKWPERDDDHSPPNAKVKNGAMRTFTPLYALMAWAGSTSIYHVGVYVPILCVTNRMALKHFVSSSCLIMLTYSVSQLIFVYALPFE